jgi:hypothetical protein
MILSAKGRSDLTNIPVFNAKLKLNLMVLQQQVIALIQVLYQVLHVQNFQAVSGFPGAARQVKDVTEIII